MGWYHFRTAGRVQLLEGTRRPTWLGMSARYC